VTAGHAVPLSGRDGPTPTTLRRLYAVEQWSMADLQARYRVGSPTVRWWLLDAGIEIRPRGSGGFRRQLVAPSPRELAELGRGLPAPETHANADCRDRDHRQGDEHPHPAVGPSRGARHGGSRNSAGGELGRPRSDRLQEFALCLPARLIPIA